MWVGSGGLRPLTVPIMVGWWCASHGWNNHRHSDGAFAGMPLILPLLDSLLIVHLVGARWRSLAVSYALATGVQKHLTFAPCGF